MFPSLLLLLLFAPTFPSELIENELANKADQYCDAVTLLNKYDTWNFRLNEITKDVIVDFDETNPNKHLKVRLCGSLNSTCNGHMDYGICLLENDGHEVRVGKTPPRMEIFQNRLIFSFTGDACNETHDYSVVADMKCDLDIGHAYFIQQVVRTHQCQFHLTLLTSSACIKRRESDCFYDENTGDYDLAPLLAKNKNHVVQINETLTVILNICQSLVLEDEFRDCHLDAAVCLVNQTDPARTSYRNLGQMQENTSIRGTVNGNLRIVYGNGEPCSPELPLTRSQTSITFICDMNASDTVPEYVAGAEICRYEFVWRTAAACSQHALEAKSLAAQSGFCRVQDPVSNSQRDLSFLADSVPKIMRPDGSEYHFSICGKVRVQVCKQDTGVCKVSPDGRSGVSGGLFNGHLFWREGGVFLNYTGGDTCQINDQPRYTVINLLCGRIPGAELTEEACHTIIQLTAPHFCPQDCPYVNRDGSLERLVRLSENYTMRSDDGNRSTFYLNMCRSLFPDRFYDCPYGAGICKVLMDREGKPDREISLGFADPLPRRSGGAVILTFSNGSRCEEQLSRSLSSRITFACDATVEQGQPEFERYDDCVYYFRWKTRMACGLANATVNQEKCSVRSAENVTWDLSVLRDTGVHKVTSKMMRSSYPRRTYSVSICGGTDGKTCDGSFVCDEDLQHDKRMSVQIDYARQLLKFQVADGSTCDYGTRFRSITLDVKCESSAGIGAPVLLWDQPCYAHLEWQTNSTCAPTEEIIKEHESKPNIYLVYFLVCGTILSVTGVITSLVMLWATSPYYPRQDCEKFQRWIREWWLYIKTSVQDYLTNLGTRIGDWYNNVLRARRDYMEANVVFEF